MLPWRQPAAFLLLVLLLGVLSCHHVATARPEPAAAAGLRPHADGAAKHLQDAGRGSRVAGLAELKRYLARFGYMHYPSPRAEHDDDAFDARMEAAVKRYQSRLGLPVTGRLDTATLGRIASPRCGIPDARVSMSLSESAVHRFTFSDGKPRWTGPDPLVLTYSISPSATVDYPPPEAVRAAFRSAFARWAEVIPMEFVEIDDYYFHDRADIKVGFYQDYHGDGSPFDGQGGVLAHAFGPKDGRLHLDAAEHWTMDVGRETSDRAVDLESVATHEIGHVLGLHHSSTPEAVMYPYIDFREKKVELSVDDIHGVQQLYGYKPWFRHEQDDAPSQPRRSDPSPSGSRGTGSRLAGLVISFVALVMLVTHL